MLDLYDFCAEACELVLDGTKVGALLPKISEDLRAVWLPSSCQLEIQVSEKSAYPSQYSRHIQDLVPFQRQTRVV